MATLSRSHGVSRSGNLDWSTFVIPIARLPGFFGVQSSGTRKENPRRNSPTASIACPMST
jgi:hypothetical protein